MLAQSWTIASVTTLQKGKVETDLAIEQFAPVEGDPTGMLKVIEIFEHKLFEPDLIYMTGDPGSVAAMAQVLPAKVPFLAYVPIEGEPIINGSWRAILSHINFFTCSKYGQEIVKRDVGKDIDFVYHGVDTDSFQPLTPAGRDEYRARLGWTNKFVVTAVAQNVRRKQLTRLIEAVSILKNVYHEDVLLYLHTVPFQNYWLEGWNLPEIAAGFGVESSVVFHPLMSEFGKAVPENGTVENPGLVELMGSADLFVLPSQVEGFGLPTVEAMAVGLPVAVTKYAAGWEIAELGGGTGIKVHDWEIHKSGTRYANLDPMEIAKTILALKRSPSKLARMREQGLAAVSQFDWSVFEEYVIGEAQNVIIRHAAGNELPPEENQGRQEAGS